MKFAITSSLLAFAIQTQAITLLQVLQSYPDLSTLSSYVNASSNATALLANANNFTFLAPSNAAIAKLISNNANVLTEDLLQATVEYSLLKGGYPSLSFTDTPQFAATNLVNSSFANVTGGQTIELLQSSDGIETLTGNKSISTSSSADIVCNGGIVHIVDTVPSIPLSAVSEITAANLKYFVSILTVGNYLNTANTYVNDILSVPDVTYFIPNSAAALSNVSALVKNSSAADLQANFEYHVVTGFVGYSTLLGDGLKLKTAQGDSLSVTVRDGEMWINAAKVIESDLIVANGVVHVIDNLLNQFDTSPPLPATSTTATPSSSTPTPTSSSSTNAPVLNTKTSSSTSHSTTTTIGIAVGSAAGGIALLSLLIFFLYRRRRSQKSKQRKERPTSSIQSLSTSPPSPFPPSPTSNKEKNIYVQNEIDVYRQPHPYPYPLRVDTSPRMRGVDEFQSLHYDDLKGREGEIPRTYGGVGGGIPIPPKSPERGVGIGGAGGRGEQFF